MATDRRGGQRGLSLMELILSFGLFTLLLVILSQALFDSSKLWRRVSGKTDSEFQLRKALMRLRGDLLEADIGQFRTNANPPAVWFLSNQAPPSLGSPQDPTPYIPQYNFDGTARWQRQVLYYLIKPADHDAVAGMSCPGSTSSADSICPHKVLIREEVDENAPPGTDPTNVFAAQALSDLTAFLNAPTALNVAPMVTGQVVRAELVAINLLYLNVTVGPPGQPEEVDVDLRAVRLVDAAHNIQIGSADLGASPYTIQYPLTVVPEN